VRSAGVSGKIACCFRTDLHFADGDAIGGWDWANLEMHLEVLIKSTRMHLEAFITRVCRCTCGSRSSELRCTWRPSSSEFGDAFGNYHHGNLEGVMERVRRRTSRLRSSELRDALGGWNRASLEMHLEAMTDRDWRTILRRSVSRRWIEKEGATGSDTLFIGSVVIVRM